MDVPAFLDARKAFKLKAFGNRILECAADYGQDGH